MKLENLSTRDALSLIAVYNQSVRSLSPYEITHLRRYKPTLLYAVENGEYGEQPVEYVTGKVEFAGHVWKVTPDVLIPRVETEELVERAVFSAQKLTVSGKKLVVVDVGTGSGALGLAVWSRCRQLGIKNLTLFLMDISGKALSIARDNYRLIRSQLIEQGSAMGLSPSSLDVQFIQSDLLEQLPAGVRVDILLANLPYIPTDRLSSLPISVRDYEPTIALDGGSDGLYYITKLLNQAALVMKKRAVCWLEIDDTHTGELILSNQQLSSQGWRIEELHDSFGNMRFARCHLARKK